MEKNEGLKEEEIKIVKVIRLDKTGCPIVKGQKGHKITFCDEVIVGKPIHNIIFVECYKQFNLPPSDMEVADECCLLI
ncbi:unnamed protein product [Paramecium pentaurelia]|uniref:Uncharacterized protein n=1 Tax=Paramecium pentaurelia TaxID=43138 RepID=A0A8S1VJS3_9CILI|nr:unnamed protein product [Paramecium pentaurelia]